MGNWLGRWRRALAKALAPDMVEGSELAAVQEQLAQSERRFHAVTDNLPVIITQFDLDGRFTFINKYIGTVLPQRPEELLGAKLREITGDALYESVSVHIDRAFQGHKVEFDICFPVGGVDRYFTGIYSPELDDTGAVVSVFALWHDITERKQSELRLRAITDNLPAVICYLDAELKIEFANATFTSWLGKSASTVVGCRLADLVNEFPDSPAAQGLMPFMLRALHGERVEFEFTTFVDNHERWLHYTVVPQFGQDGAVLGILALCADVSELKRVQRQLSELARFDELTGLPNRYQFNEKMAEAVQRLARASQPMGLLFLDVDHFKQINDTHGHAAGDEVLREFARRLLASVRATDTVARLAGDEFVIVLEAVADRAAMQRVADKILAAMLSPMLLPHGELRISSSIGGAFAESSKVEPRLLLDCADLALYDAKRAGRGTYRLRDYAAPQEITA
nr:diguanylate cyclase [Pseudoduganella umbonata]